jgi:hypothetical protein
VIEAYECLKEVEEYLRDEEDMKSAGDLLEFGRSKGWLGA